MESKTTKTVYESNFKVDAYPFYEHLRRHDPVFAMSQQSQQTSWLVTKYDDVKEILKKQTFMKDPSKFFSNESLEENEQQVITIFDNMMLDADPPDHTRLRKLVQPYFNPIKIKALEPRIREIADHLLLKMKNKQEPVDLIDDYAFPLPIIVISELLGVPAEDRNQFRKWSNTILAVSDGLETNFEEDVTAFIEYLSRLFEERKDNPRDDLISSLLQAEEEGQQLSRNELYSMIVLLIIAGHETTVNLIGNTMYALFEHPKQLEKLKGDLSLTPNAVEEGLGYYSPVDFSTNRWAEEDIEFHGKRFRRGDLVLASLSSANRDEEKFPNPDVFDITREQIPHVAFGFGIHFCLGAPLARLEGKIAIEKLLTAFPDLCLAKPCDHPNWRAMFLLKGLETLEVHLN